MGELPPPSEQTLKNAWKLLRLTVFFLQAHSLTTRRSRRGSNPSLDMRGPGYKGLEPVRSYPEPDPPGRGIPNSRSTPALSTPPAQQPFPANNNAPVSVSQLCLKRMSPVLMNFNWICKNLDN